MFIPVGLDEARLARWPVVSTAILVACAGALALQASSPADEEADARWEELVSYWSRHPELAAPEGFEARTHVAPGRLLEIVGRSGRAASPARVEAADPARLAELTDALGEALAARPEQRWGLVPSRGLAQPGWLTAIFLHGDLFHLLGNMLIFILVVGPFLEDAWGRPFFLGLFMLGGVVAGAAQALPHLSSSVPIIGASGAISACLGAFALRFAHRRVRIFYWFFLFLRGTFFVPAWAYALFGFAVDLWSLSATGGTGGVAYGAHVGGFLFGVAAAMTVRASGLEEKLAPEGAGRWGSSLSASRASDALAGGDLVAARQQLEKALASNPADDASLLALARLEAGRFERARVTALVERLVTLRVQARDLAGAAAVVRELGGMVEARLLRPATAFRAAELVAAADPALADQLDEAATAAGGTIAVKALLRQATRAGRRDLARVHDLLERAVATPGAPPELSERARRMLADLPPPPPPGFGAIELD